MTTKEKLHVVIDRLDEVQVRKALEYRDDLTAATDRTYSTDQASGPAIVSGRAFFSALTKTWQDVAREQGVGPISDIDAWRGDFWPEDEVADEFVEAVRQWRREG